MASLTETFYGLHVETRRRLGVPVQPKRFFRLLWRELLERDLGFVLVAYHGEPGCVRRLSLVQRLAGLQVRSLGARGAQVRPNNLLFWHVIRWAAEEGYSALDFGRTDLDQQGLRSFKSGWGAVEEPLVYSYLADQAPTTPVHRSSAFVAPLIRRSPEWVTRALGELLYRYAA